MIQQDNVKLICQRDDHKDEIETEFRLNCFKCKQNGIHHAHFDDMEEVNTLIKFMENKNKECENLIDDLNFLVESVNQSFSQLKRGIKYKYSLLKERLSQLNLQQIIAVLNSMINLTEYKKSITKIICEQIRKLIHSFNNLFQQLSLSSIDYYQIPEIEIQQSKELYDKGYQLYWDDKYQEAIQILDKSIQLNPKNNQSLQCKVRVYQLLRIQFLGHCLHAQQKYLEALIYYDKLLLINPNDEQTKKIHEYCQNSQFISL